MALLSQFAAHAHALEEVDGSGQRTLGSGNVATQSMKTSN
jgi:hypothetical protein